MMETAGFTEPKSKDDGGIFVPVSNQRRAPTAEQASTPDEAVNLCKLFKPEELKNMAVKCIDDYDSDVRSRSGRMKKLREYTELYASLLKAKNFPFQNCANVNLPTLTGPCLQVHARLYDMVWPANGKVFSSTATSLGDTFRANVTEKFGNSYIRHKMPEMGTGLDDTMAQVVIYGSAFRRTYWNGYEGRVASDYIPMEDFVVAHSVRSQDPSMRDVARYTMVQHLTIFDLEMYAHQGVFENVNGLRAEDVDLKTSDLQATVDKIDGVSAATEATDEDKPRQVLEQHRLWRLPDRKGKNPAFDGRPHPVMITIDETSKRVLRIVLREEDDPADLKRFQKEQQEYQQFQIMQQAYDQQSAIISRVMTVADQLGKEIPAEVEAQMPQAPMPVEEPRPMRKREICFFTHYRAFPSEGFYGLGFGDFIGPLAKAVNIMVNQHIDGVTLRNAKPGFMSRQLRMQRGPINVSPGALNEIDGPLEAVKNGIWFMDPPLNDPTTMPLAQMIIAQGDKVAGSGDLMSGSTSGANRTAKEIQVLNSQVMMQITVLSRRTKESFKHELDKIWRCWGVFLPDQEIVDVVTESGEPEQIPVSRSMFIPDAHVQPTADPRMKFEKIEDQNVLYQLVLNNPFLMQSPQAPVLMRAVTEDLLRAHGAEKLIPLMPQIPPPPPPPAPKAPFEEAAGWLRGQDNPPHPDDNDAEHLADHAHFLGSAEGAALDKPGRDMAERHVRHHVAQKIEKTKGGPPGGMPPVGRGPPPQPGMGGPPPAGPPPGMPPQ